jgi:hypothetical protein
MKTKDLMTITTVALTTATLTVMTFWSEPLEAGHEGDGLVAKIAKPKLVSHGIEMTLDAVEGGTLKAGGEPAFELTAINTTGQPVTAAIRVEMRASSPADMLSRVPRLPSALWQQNLTLTLNPNETTVVSLPARTKLPANSMIAVSLHESEPVQTTATAIGQSVRPAFRPGASPESGIVALNFSTFFVPVVQTASVK